jgi:hypothetical protein
LNAWSLICGALLDRVLGDLQLVLVGFLQFTPI